MLAVISVFDGASARQISITQPHILPPHPHTQADFKTYATHPEHVKALTEVVKPVLATRTAVQFKI